MPDPAVTVARAINDVADAVGSIANSIDKKELPAPVVQFTNPEPTIQVNLVAPGPPNVQIQFDPQVTISPPAVSVEAPQVTVQNNLPPPQLATYIVRVTERDANGRIVEMMIMPAPTV